MSELRFAALGDSITLGMGDPMPDGNWRGWAGILADLARIGAALTWTVGALREAGAVVLTTRLPDPGRMFGLPEALARPLARRIQALNLVTDVVAQRYSTLHFDAANHPSTYDRRMWSVDRLHPSERGHRLLAGAYFDLLTDAGLASGIRPSAEPARWTRRWTTTSPTRCANCGPAPTGWSPRFR